MAITYLDVQALASGEFATLSQAVIEDAMEEAALLLDEGSWGTTYYDRGHLLATAHILSLAVLGSTVSAGPISSQTAGQVSLTYSTVGGVLTTQGWGATSYGRRLQAFQRKLFYGPKVL